MGALDLIMRQPGIYRLWMAPFAEKKFAPILANNNMDRVRRVLDVGCGPGTNALHFSFCDYLGIDVNPQYIRDAEQRCRLRHGRFEFRVHDAATFVAGQGERFDFVLVNSLLHHVNDAVAGRILSNVSRLLTDDGYVHIIELVFPEEATIPRFVARADRGKFVRPLETWRSIFEEFFEPTRFEPFGVTVSGVCMWKLVYFKGKAKIPGKIHGTDSASTRSRNPRGHHWTPGYILGILWPR